MYAVPTGSRAVRQAGGGPDSDTVTATGTGREGCVAGTELLTLAGTDTGSGVVIKKKKQLFVMK